jgi:hypothetical protein
MQYNSSYLHTTSITFSSIFMWWCGGGSKGHWLQESTGSAVFKTEACLHNQNWARTDGTGPVQSRQIWIISPQQQSWNRTTMQCSDCSQCEHFHLATHKKLLLYADVQQRMRPTMRNGPSCMRPWVRDLHKDYSEIAPDLCNCTGFTRFRFLPVPTPDPEIRS